MHFLSKTILAKKRLFFKIASLLLIFVFFFHSLGVTYAESTEELEKQLRDKQNEIKQVEQQLKDTQNQEKTLKSQLDFIDGQTKLTELKIQEAQFQLIKLEKEIDELSGRIDRLSTSVDQISEVLLNRIVKTYKYSNISPIELLFSSDSISDLLAKIKYVQVAQANDKKVLYQLQATKATYNDQKSDKETRQTEQEKRQKDLEKYQDQLAEQKKQKAELLKVTQNDEQKYQQLLVKLRADTESIARALSGGGVKLGEVNKGDRIASVGTSGCSTGYHLHMEVMTSARIENGAIIGRENKVNPKSYIDSGQFPKPTSSYSGGDCSQGGTCHNGDITTRFGQTYFLGTHTGLDIADFAGASIYAADKGTAYAFSDSQACKMTGTVGKGVAIDHHNGMVTLYWHIP